MINIIEKNKFVVSRENNCNKNQQHGLYKDDLANNKYIFIIV